MSTRTGSNLASREKRLRLKAGKRHGVSLAPGLTLVYRRSMGGDASWSVRQRDCNGKAPLRRLGAADDETYPDGVTVLSFEQAVRRAPDTGSGEPDAPAPNTITVRQAADRYMVWFRDHRKGVMTVESALRVHILPTFGHRLIVTLTAAELTAFLNKMATTAPRRRTSALAEEIKSWSGAGDGRCETATSIDGEPRPQHAASDSEQGLCRRPRRDRHRMASR